LRGVAPVISMLVPQSHFTMFSMALPKQAGFKK